MQTDGRRLWAQLMWRAVRRNREVLSLFRVVGRGGSRRCHTSLPKASHLPTGASAALGSQGASWEASKGYLFMHGRWGAEESLPLAIGLSPELQSDPESVSSSGVEEDYNCPEFCIKWSMLENPVHIWETTSLGIKKTCFLKTYESKNVHLSALNYKCSGDNRAVQGTGNL